MLPLNALRGFGMAELTGAAVVAVCVLMASEAKGIPGLRPTATANRAPNCLRSAWKKDRLRIHHYWEVPLMDHWRKGCLVMPACQATLPPGEAAADPLRAYCAVVD